MKRVHWKSLQCSFQAAPLHGSVSDLREQIIMPDVFDALAVSDIGGHHDSALQLAHAFREFLDEVHVQFHHLRLDC